jgi:hypothetical protein
MKDKTYGQMKVKYVRDYYFYTYGKIDLMKKTGACKHHQSTVYSLKIKVYLQMAVKKY